MEKSKLKNFDDFNLTIGEIFYLIVKSFLSKSTYLQVRQDLQICKETYTKIKKRIRHLISLYYETLPKLSDDGGIIEIDEAKFIKSKVSANHKGRKVKWNDWVVGLIERNTKKFRDAMDQYY